MIKPVMNAYRLEELSWSHGYRDEARWEQEDKTPVHEVSAAVHSKQILTFMSVFFFFKAPEDGTMEHNVA